MPWAMRRTRQAVFPPAGSWLGGLTTSTRQTKGETVGAEVPSTSLE